MVFAESFSFDILLVHDGTSLSVEFKELHTRREKNFSWEVLTTLHPERVCDPDASNSLGILFWKQERIAIQFAY